LPIIGILKNTYYHQYLPQDSREESREQKRAASYIRKSPNVWYITPKKKERERLSYYCELKQPNKIHVKSKE